MSVDPIIVEQVYPASRTDVWAAITDQEKMRQWYFDTMSAFEAVVGFEAQFNVRCEGKDYLHVWNVTEVVPPQRLSYEWRFGGYPGDSLVTWELTDVEGGTSLKLTHDGHETIMGDPIFSRENGLAGWTYLLQQNLKTWLDSES